MSVDVLTAAQLDAMASGTASTPEMQPVADLMAGALVRLLVEVRAPQGAARLHGWLTSTEAVLAAPLLDGQPPAEARYRLVLTHPTYILAQLCNVLEVGPRPPGALAVPAQVPAAAVSLLAGGSAGEELPEALRPVADDVRQVWSVRATWAGPNGQERRSAVEVIDATSGYLAVERGPQDAQVATIAPVTPTDVFCLLGGVLPGDADFEV